MTHYQPWAYERGALWVRECGECDGDDSALATPRINATLGEARPDDTEALARAMGLGDPEPVRLRFNSGRHCFVARVDGAIASYGWVSQGAERIGELERSFRMPTHEAYIWDCATLPQYRGQRLYGALLSYIVSTLCHEGMQRLWIGASLQNTPSIRGFAIAGFKPVLTLTFLRFLGMRRIWITDDPAIAPELVAQARASLAG